jgi:hypothetical protein
MTRRCAAYRFWFLRSVVLALLATACSNLWAEVGATVGSAPGAPSLPYELVGISDDSDPFTIWARLRPDTNEIKVLNDQGDVLGDGPPSVVWHPVTRLPMVAWARNSASGFDVVLSVFENDAWTTPQVLADGPEDELDPSLVLDPVTGDVHLFYWVNDSEPRVLHRQAPLNLSSWTPPLQVSQASEKACRPAGTFYGGVLFVAYEDHTFGVGQTPRNVVLSERIGSVFVPQVVAITSFDGENRPRVHSHRGRMWVDWIDAEDEAAWIRKDLQGQWEPVRYESYTGPEEREFHVRGAIRMQAAE